MVLNKQQLYGEVLQQVTALMSGEKDRIANMANISSVLYWALPEVNWAGFYLLKDQQLVLGPFHGKPACIRIPLGKGVCGTAAAENKVQIVQDVHQFTGHIACDSASNSEIVLPIVDSQQRLLGVLDLDSPAINRFDQVDEAGLSQIVQILQGTL
jgi:GAF domain-containing protein